MKKDIRKIIDWSLDNLNMNSKDASALVYRTGMAESGYRHLSQMGSGPAVGFFQVEPATIDDTWNNYVVYRKPVKEALEGMGYDPEDSRMRVMSSIPLQAAFCRLKYRRDRLPIPSADDVHAQASYWKRVYNTELGKGSVKHFIKANEKRT